MNREKPFIVFLLLLCLATLSCGGVKRGRPVSKPSPLVMKSALVPAGGIIFPMGTLDDRRGSIEKPFALAETEVTNELAATILQWAYDSGKLSDTETDHNGVSGNTVKFGRQILVNLGQKDCYVNFSGGQFSVDPGYEDHPFVWVSWYGAVLLCNWLTEMEEGNSDQVVYTGIPADGSLWMDDNTFIDETRTGYRLPTTMEWEYAARYLGTVKPAKGPLAREHISEKTGYSGPGKLTAGYYWTPGLYASGAAAGCSDAAASARVAVFYENSSGSYPQQTAEVATKKSNALGLYDMCGNVWEWNRTDNGKSRLVRGVCWSSSIEYLHVGFMDDYPPYFFYNNLGLRLCRTLE